MHLQSVQGVGALLQPGVARHPVPRRASINEIELGPLEIIPAPFSVWVGVRVRVRARGSQGHRSRQGHRLRAGSARVRVVSGRP